MKRLSIRAQAIAAGYFGLNPTMKLTLWNVENRLTEENAKAMQELIDKNLVRAARFRDGRVTYTLTEEGRKADLKRSLAWMEKHGRFALTEPIPATTN